MSHLVRIDEGAQQEISEIYDWLFARSPLGAQKWFNRFLDVLLAIEKDPSRFACITERDFPGRDLREVIFKTRRGARYRAVFLVQDATVTVLRVRSPRQRPLEEGDL